MHFIRPVSSSTIRMGSLRCRSAVRSAISTQSPYSFFSYFITTLAKSVYLRVATAAAGSVRISRSASLWNLFIVLRILLKRLRLHAMAPATGGWPRYTRGAL